MRRMKKNTYEAFHLTGETLEVSQAVQQFSLDNKYALTANLGHKNLRHRPNRAALPNSASISKRRLYLAIRSLRQAEPVLIWPPPIATAKSAKKASSVSPERCDTT